MAIARSAVFGAARPPRSGGRMGARMRPVERFRVHGPPVDFRDLCRRAVPPTTKLVVLDLDRTVHLGRNLGELLGWEITAHLGYGPSYLGEIEAARTGGRTFVDPSRPLAALRYLSLGARVWGPPGLFYLLWGKIAWHTERLRRRAYLRFGPEAVRAVQKIPQQALLHQIAALPAATVTELARRLFRRYAADQTIDAADVAWLRERCPGVKVVISSASPRPSVAVAGAELGADAIVCTEVEDAGDRSASPCDLSRLGRPAGLPHRISRPSRQSINTGVAKLDALVAHFPELLDRSVESVGITDTGYGEDHSWTELFGTVVDVNSDAPFPPVIASDAPARAIHSALIRTRAERDAVAAGRPWLDPRRDPIAPGVVDLTAAALMAKLGGLLGEIEGLARALEAREAEIADARERERAALVELDALVERAVDGYNAAPAGGSRARALRDVDRLLALQAAVARRIVAIERPLSEVAFALTVALAKARAAALG